MVDVVSKKVRSRMMSGIRAKDTNPEIIIRKGIHSRGFRYKLHDSNLPGKPDLVFQKYKAVIFVNGCFWHAHGCHLFKWPKTRPDFWKEKINGNKSRDAINISKLNNSGWRTLVVWECALKGKFRLDHEIVAGKVVEWLKSGSSHYEISGEESDL